MPLYDPDNALSAEAPALEALGVLLANTAGFRRLVEVGDEFEAAEKVLVGPWDAEQDQDDQTLAEEFLEQLFAFAQLMPAEDESHTDEEDDAAASCPVEGGTFEIDLRRQVRPEELAGGGRRDVYLYVLDCVSSIERELVELSWEWGEPRVRGVRRTEGPVFVALDEEGAQGVAVFATLSVAWGHLEQN